MSYYGIRKQRIVQNEEGKYNIQCDIYDSSLRDYDGKRIWYTDKILFNTWEDTKQDLEWKMFKDILDGNIHGASGKFSSIGWNSRKKQHLPNADEWKTLEMIEISNRQLRHDLSNKRNQLNGSVAKGWKTQEQAQAEYEPFKEEICKYIDINENLYYNIWYKAWKRYLKESRGK